MLLYYGIFYPIFQVLWRISPRQNDLMLSHWSENQKLDSESSMHKFSLGWKTWRYDPESDWATDGVIQSVRWLVKDDLILHGIFSIDSDP